MRQYQYENPPIAEMRVPTKSRQLAGVTSVRRRYSLRLSSFCWSQKRAASVSADFCGCAPGCSWPRPLLGAARGGSVEKDSNGICGVLLGAEFPYLDMRPLGHSVHVWYTPYSCDHCMILSFVVSSAKTGKRKGQLGPAHRLQCSGRKHSKRGARRRIRPGPLATAE